MKLFNLLLLSIFSFASSADFRNEANELAENLKKSLLSQVQLKMKEGGVKSAIEYCELNALPLTSQLATEKYNIGRTTTKLRNPKNAPEEWMKSYLAAAEKTTIKNPYETQVVRLKTGKKAFLSPLYVGAPCLQCHGTLTEEVSAIIKENYPNDKATGYNPGEFRGFVWVQEK